MTLMYNDESFFGEFGQMRCQPNGNYDPIQCVQQVGSDGVCFCIDTKSVEVVSNDTMVNFKDIESVDALSCYDPENMFHNSNHYRSCEMETMRIYDLKVADKSCVSLLQLKYYFTHIKISMQQALYLNH